MLINASRLIQYPVLSLHVGGEIARTEAAIIDPKTLKIVGFWLTSDRKQERKILETKAVRELAEVGMIVDSEEVLTEEEENVKLRPILELNFELIGLKVETKKGSKLGKVVDYTVDTETFKAHQLIIRRPTLKAILDPELIIPRKEIVEVTDYKIIVKDEEEKIRVKALKEDFVPNFVNPFREPDFSARRVVREKNSE